MHPKFGIKIGSGTTVDTIKAYLLRVLRVLHTCKEFLFHMSVKYMLQLATGDGRKMNFVFKSKFGKIL